MLTPQPGFGAAATANEDAGFDFMSVIRMDVHLAGSGGLDDLSLCRGPVFSRTGVVVRNGQGINPRSLASWSAPLLGGTWVSGLDCAGHGNGMGSVALFSEEIPGTVLGFGELLVGGTRYLSVTRSHQGNAQYFSLDIPHDLNLVGMEFHAQGLCGGSPGLELSNALKVRLGF